MVFKTIPGEVHYPLIIQQVWRIVRLHPEYQKFVFKTVLLELRYESGYLYDHRCWRLKQSSP